MNKNQFLGTTKKLNCLDGLIYITTINLSSIVSASPVSFTSIEVEVVDKKLNRGDGYGLEILVIYHFYGQEKIVQWLTKNLETIKKSQNVEFLNV